MSCTGRTAFCARRHRRGLSPSYRPPEAETHPPNNSMNVSLVDSHLADLMSREPWRLFLFSPSRKPRPLRRAYRALLHLVDFFALSPIFLTHSAINSTRRGAKKKPGPVRKGSGPPRLARRAGRRARAGVRGRSAASSCRAGAAASRRPGTEPGVLWAVLCHKQRFRGIGR